MSLRFFFSFFSLFLYRLRKPTNRTALHFLHHVPAHPCFIFYPVSLSSLHILLHAPSVFSHLLWLSLSPAFRLLFYFSLSPRCYLFFSFSLPQSLQPPLSPVIKAPRAAQVFITCWTALFAMISSAAVLLFFLPHFSPPCPNSHPADGPQTVNVEPKEMRDWHFFLMRV